MNKYKIIKKNNCLLIKIDRQFLSLIVMLFYLFLEINLDSNAQEVKDHTVRINAIWDTQKYDLNGEDIEKQGIRLFWYEDLNALDYNVFRKSIEDNSFVLLKSSLGIVNSYFDSSAQKNNIYEYQVQKVGNYLDTAEYIVSGYVATKFEDKILDENYNEILERDLNKGDLLILVDNTIYEDIKKELFDYIFTVKLDGWNVIVRKAPRANNNNQKLANITKSIVLSVVRETKIDNILLLGRLPIKYSGDFAIDGHRDHWGAWQFDGYYGDLIDLYKDSINYKIQADAIRQHNLINDGKFDETRIINKIEIGVGRLDFYNLPYFKESEIELHKRYLTKNINYRNSQYFEKINNQGDYIDNAIINDNFGNGWRNKFAATAFNSFTPLVDWSLIDKFLSKENTQYVFEERMRENVRTKDYFMAYGCASGSYTSCYDVAYSEEYANTPVRTIFQSVFGSYNGDFDSENNLMRATTASLPSNLICYWSARPFWNLQSLSLGKSWGYATKVTQNNFNTYSHQSRDGNNVVHIALIGDPSLDILNVTPPQKIKVNKTVAQNIYNINFEANKVNKTDEVIGYNIFKIEKSNFDFSKFSEDEINNIENIDKYLWLEANQKELFNSHFKKVNENIIYPKPSGTIEIQNLELDFENNFYFLSTLYYKKTPSSNLYKSSILKPIYK